MAAKLMGNLFIMGIILRMDDFTKEQQIGVYCITCAILTLPEVGPSDQDCIDARHLVYQPHAIIWELILFGATAGCIIGMVWLSKKESPPQNTSMLVYVTAQVVSAVINASVSKMLALDIGAMLLGVCFILVVVCAAVNVISLALAAKSVDQGLFIPYATCSTLLTNMVTGQIVWEEWRVVNQWISFIMAHMIMCLGVALLKKDDVVEQYKLRERAELVLRATEKVQEVIPRVRDSFVELSRTMSVRGNGRTNTFSMCRPSTTTTTGESVRAREVSTDVRPSFAMPDPLVPERAKTTGSAGRQRAATMDSQPGKAFAALPLTTFGGRELRTPEALDEDESNPSERGSQVGIAPMRASGIIWHGATIDNARLSRAKLPTMVDVLRNHRQKEPFFIPPPAKAADIKVDDVSVC